MSEPPELSVVVPVYNEAGNIDEFLRRLVPLLEANVRDYEIIFAARPLHRRHRRHRSASRGDATRAIKLLLFSRRFGQPTATLAGIEHASGDAVVVMDVDLQDPPELLVEMLAKWRDGFDVVYAQRRSRNGETLVKRIGGQGRLRAHQPLRRCRHPAGHRRLPAARPPRRRRARPFKETHGFLRGLVALVGFEQTAVEFDRPARHAGKGNYNRLLGSLRIGFNGLVALLVRAAEPQHRPRLHRRRPRLRLGRRLHMPSWPGSGFPVGNPTDRHPRAVHRRVPADLPRDPRPVRRADLRRGQAAPALHRLASRWASRRSTRGVDAAAATPEGRRWLTSSYTADDHAFRESDEYARAKYDMTLRWLGPAAGRTLLNVGCGNGLFNELAIGRRVPSSRRASPIRSPTPAPRPPRRRRRRAPRRALRRGVGRRPGRRAS